MSQASGSLTPEIIRALFPGSNTGSLPMNSSRDPSVPQWSMKTSEGTMYSSHQPSGDLYGMWTAPWDRASAPAAQPASPSTPPKLGGWSVFDDYREGDQIGIDPGFDPGAGQLVRDYVNRGYVRGTDSYGRPVWQTPEQRAYTAQILASQGGQKSKLYPQYNQKGELIGYHGGAQTGSPAPQAPVPQAPVPQAPVPQAPVPQAPVPQSWGPQSWGPQLQQQQQQQQANPLAQWGRQAMTQQSPWGGQQQMQQGQGWGNPQAGLSSAFGSGGFTPRPTGGGGGNDQQRSAFGPGGFGAFGS